MRTVAVLGNSSAALSAVETLQDALEGRTRTELLVVAPRNRFVYSPLIPHVVSGALRPESVAFDFTDVLADATRFECDNLQTVDLEERAIVCAGNRLSFDYLLVAPSSRPDWGGCRPADGACAAWTLEGASTLRAYLDERVEQFDEHSEPPDRATRTLAVVGGGAAGIEVASEIRRAGRPFGEARADVPSSSKPDVPVCVLEKRSELLPDGPEPLRAACRAHFRSADIWWRTDTAVASCEPNRLELSDGEHLRVDAVAHCSGTRPPEWLADSPLPTDQDGRIRVAPNLRVPNTSGLYAAGASAAPPDLPAMRAHLAAQQGRRAAENLRADLSGRTLREWRPGDESWLLTLGSSGAAVFSGDSLMTGRAAGTLYRLRHASWIPEPLADSGAAQTWLREGFHPDPDR